MDGQLVLRPMLKDEQMTLLELHYQAGTKAPMHTHTHESLIYVVAGRVKTWIGNDVYILGPVSGTQHHNLYRNPGASVKSGAAEPPLAWIPAPRRRLKRSVGPTQGGG